ncbi:MAG TPA: transporter substrate-binding domain-containing protein [Casimicrobiaceae bacterium]|jgi:polar amino acid transport system substrate-binding protein|nr:transporter substrate-binding domain-containing protein [Casimicrobiaceae bacterium]
MDALLRMGRRAASALLLGLIGITVSGIAAAQAPGASSRLDEIVKRDKLIVATFSTAPPFCYTDEAGKLVGFDIDIAKFIAKSLLGDEKKIEFVTVTSEGRWPAVNSGRADIGIATTTVYPDRALRVAFTRPYIDSGISILVRDDTNVTNLAGLNNAKFTLANLSNPQMADRAKRFLPNVKLLTFDTPAALFTAVKSGQAQAMQMDTPVVNWYAANNKDMKVLPENLAVVQGNAIFMKPGDFTLWLWMDTVVQEMTAGSRYTEYTEIYKKWFGTNPPPQRFYGATGSAK